MTLIAFLMAAAIAAVGQSSLPVPLPVAAGDARIQTVLFSPERVVPLYAAAGYALVVELGDDEHVENVVVGSSGGWQVTANKRGDHLIVKPGTSASTTDLVVTTDVRRYVFLLQLAGSGEPAPFVVHFIYPEQLVATTATSSATIATYQLHGDKALFPAAISDDGQRTTVAWSRATPLPAVYASDTAGHEAIVNGRMVDGAFVIQGTAPRYVFRLGKAQAIAVRHLEGPAR